MPLTADRAKPAVPFGGSYRLVDFVLSNFVNGGIDRICVLTQYKSHSLDRHISLTWRMSTMLGQYVTPVPAQQRLGPRWYQGSADAIFQSLNLVYDETPDHVVVFGADHVYRMDPRQMIEAHVASGAGITVAGIRIPRAGASGFGIIQTSDGRRIDAKAVLAMIANAGSFLGGRFAIGPDVKPDDGELDLCLFMPERTRDVFALLWRLLRKDFRPYPLMTFARGRVFRVSSEPSVCSCSWRITASSWRWP